jgi:hypothetical protein
LNLQSGYVRSTGYSEPGRMCSPDCVEPKLGSPADRKGFQTRTGSAIPRTAVVEGVTLATLVAGTITMSIIGVLLGIFCWALFALATHALPFFVGMTVGIYSFQAGAGPFGAIVVGFVTAGFTLVVGQYGFSVACSRIVRHVFGLLFAVPAAYAGYDVTLALAHLGIPEEWGAGVFCRAWRDRRWKLRLARVSMQTDTALRPGAALSPIQLSNGATTTGG